MKFGICCRPEYFAIAAEAGYDYVEVSLFENLRPLDPDDHGPAQLAAALKSARTRALSGFLFIPGTMRLVGEQRDIAVLAKYAETLCRRASAAGIELLVLGSGAARALEAGQTAADARAQLIEFLRLAADSAQRWGVRTAIEPLCARDCNFINTVAEGLDIARSADRPGQIGVLADLYHMTAQGENYDGLRAAGSAGLLWHAHVACGLDRHSPAPGDEHQLAEFFGELRACGYRGNVSLEVAGVPQDPAEALETMRRAASI